MTKVGDNIDLMKRADFVDFRSVINYENFEGFWLLNACKLLLTI